jgi:type VI secretion system secreted protein VgrG
LVIVNLQYTLKRPLNMAHPYSIKTPLPEQDLLLQTLACEEGLGEVSNIKATLLSPRGDLNADDLLGKPATFTLELRDNQKRFIHAYFTRFTQVGASGKYHRYEAQLRPWIAFLGRTADCRIFQHQSVPDIVKTVFQDHGIAVHEFKLFRKYRIWDYCVQYRETDLNFVSRLLEHEGIYYRFQHSEGKHCMVLVDSLSIHDPQPLGCSSLPFYPEGGGSAPSADTDFVHNWRASRQVLPGKFVATDYDFENPNANLLTQGTRPRQHALADAEIFHYPGGYTQPIDGEDYLDARMDEEHSHLQTLRGSCNAQGLQIGFLFNLTRHPRANQNAKYLVTNIHLTAHNGGYEAGDTGGASTYSCDFSAIPAEAQFRPSRSTPKSVMQGPQTAVVVGPAGDEIHTDKYGRVRVQFHWDRYGKKNEKSSCWVRVSQAWAGAKFGAMFVPRIGQEVIVDFLEGDPDQPIITGRVYNAMQMPPWELPANATQSGVLTRSSKGGSVSNANAIRFEDKKGAEQLWLHAEKNQDIEVENDETHWVGHDRTKTIDHDEKVHVKHDRTETVDNFETITIGVDRTEKVGNNEKITIGVNRTESVGSNETIGIGANRSETVGANETISIGANRSETVGANQTVSIGACDTLTVALQRTHAVGVNETIAIGAAQEVAIGAMQSISVGANQSTSVGVNQSTSVGANQTNEVGGNRSSSVGKNDQLSVGKNLVITAADSISLTTGSASITMKKDGTIVIKGKDITVQGSGNIKIKASSNVVVKGSKIGEN